MNILIVEDSPTQAENLKILLESEGYDFAWARNGAQALDRMRESLPDLVISDIVMPEMDGYELCRRVKNDPRTQSVPVILLTSLSDSTDVVKGLEAGADNFIFKPFDDSYLLKRIEFALVHRSLRESDSSRMGVEVAFGGRQFYITSDRLQILNLLLSTYETAVQRNHELIHVRDELRALNENLEARVEERTAELAAEVAERKAAEERLQEQATLLDKARDAILVLDLQRRVLYWNNSAAALYGWSAREARNRQFQQLVYRDAAAFLEAFAQTLETGEWSGESEHYTKEGKKLFVQSRLTLVRDESGQPKSILAINTDVTERKLLEEQFLRAQRLESIGTLAGGIAHDLNNLLAPIVMAVDLLKELDPSPKAASIIENIGRSARRGTDLVKQVLSFARGVQGARVGLTLDQVAQEVQSIIQKTFPKNIAFERSAPDDLWLVEGDPTQLNQVILNLCVNARDAMPEGGRLSVRCSNVVIDEARAAAGDAPPGRYVLLEVADQGCGIPKETIERIFDPFYTTKEVGKGTGLGLSTALGIARSHGGVLSVDSEVGRGTTFRLRLPARAAKDEPESPSVRAPLPRGRNQRVLVVDDEAAILDITKQTLEAFGYSVLTAKDGAQAIALYTMNRPNIDVVISDMMMPSMDGPALVSALRRLDPDIPVIAVTGLYANSPQVAEMDATCVLSKPYTAESLLTSLSAALSHAAASADPDAI